jgi:ribosomal protein S18 acetylase RimI-like enzyme
MTRRRRPALTAIIALALLLSGCGPEPASPPSPPPPTDQPPPQVGPPAEAEPDPITDQILRVVKDPSGRHTAEVVERGDKNLVIRDGQPGPEYDLVGEVAFSADGNSLAYEARRGKDHVVVLDGREVPIKADVVQNSFKVSPDHKRLALATFAKDAWLVLVDGRPHPAFDFVFIDTLAFSPDSRRLGYLALKSGKLLVVVDGKVWQKLEIVPQGNKILQDYLKQAEKTEGIPPQEEHRE